MSGEEYHCSWQGGPTEPCECDCGDCHPERIENPVRVKLGAEYLGVNIASLLDEYHKRAREAVGYFTLILEWIDDFEQGRGNRESLIRSVRRTAAMGEALGNVERRVGNGEEIQEADYEERDLLLARHNIPSDLVYRERDKNSAHMTTT